MKVTVIVAAYRDTVWVAVEPSYNGHAILDLEQVDSLVSTLTQASEQARIYKRGDVP